MPDWSYHPMKKLVLSKLSATSSRAFIHQSMQTIASIPGGRGLIGFLGHMKPSRQLKKTFHHTTFTSPIGLSSLIDPYLTGCKAFQELGFGFLEIGPVVLNPPKIQNAPIVRKQRIHFSHNPEKLTLKDALRTLTTVNFRVPLFAKLDESLDEQEWAIIVQQLTPFVDGFITTNSQLNAYAPNEHCGLRPFYVAQSADNLVDITGLQLHPCASGIVINAPVHSENNDWFEAENTHESVVTAIQSVKKLHPEFIVITSGGINTPEQASILIQAGADLCMLTEGYVRSGPGLPKRIHERLLFEQKIPVENNPWHWSFRFGLAIFIAGFIALYFAFTSIILPYDESFIGLSKEELNLLNPRILAFMSHDRMAVAGTMISAGILYMQLARHGIRLGQHWAKVAFHSAAIIGFLGIFLFIGFGYFDWLHGLFWLLLLPIYALSWKEGKNIEGSPSSHHGTNDFAWKLGVYGQLMFVLLGFSILIGGLSISTIGVSSVFVATDVSFLCMSPEMLHNMSNKLIPVIAHDRAGFGSSLVSVGLLVLMLSLWGYRAGQRWLWNTLAIGALPAFIAGLGTHFYIGYTSFIHILPVYFLIIIYILGLVCSYPFLKRAEIEFPL